MGIATILEGAIDTMLLTFVAEKSAAMCSALIPLALTGVTIYMIVMGWAIMRGDAEDSFHTFLWRAFRIAFLGSIALVGGSYQTTVVESLNAIPGAITQVFGGVGSIGAMVDNVAQPFESLGNALYAQAITPYIPNVALLIAAALISWAELFLITVAMGIYMLAKISLALCLAVGPIFVFCAMFPASQSKFEAWLGQTLNFAFLQGLLGAAIGMLYALVEQFAKQVNASTATAILTDALGLFAIVLTLCIVLLSLQGIAAAITGGATATGIGQTVGRALMKALNSEPKNGGSVTNASRGKKPSATSGVASTQAGSIRGAGNATPSTTSAFSQPSSALYNRHVLENIGRSSH